MIGNRRMRLAVAAGHKNNDGGNAYETALNGRKCAELMAELRARSNLIDARCITPNDGLGMFPGGLQGVADQVNKWHRQGWTADVLIELHSEGTHSSVRGSFVIYPDSRHVGGGDVDADVRDGGAVICEALRHRTAIPLRGPLSDGKPGVMSERESGVGGQGHRLGLFSVTVGLADFCTRLIFEAGAHTNAADKAIMDQDSFPRLHAMAVADGLMEFASARLGWTFPADEEPEPGPGEWEPDTGLVRLLGEKNHISVHGARVYRFRDTVTFLGPAVPHQYADKGARKAPALPAGRKVWVVAIIAQVNGDKWLLSEGGYRYLLSGQGVVVE